EAHPDALEPRRDRRAVRAHLDAELPVGWWALVDEREVTQQHVSTKQLVAATDRHGRGRGVDVDDVATLPHRNIEPATLADREAGNAPVASDRRPRGIDDRARPGRRPLDEELFAAAAGDETDVHALGLRRRAEAEPVRVPTDLGLGDIADWQHRPAQLPLA